MADPHREEIAKLEALYAANPDGRIFTHLAEAYRKAGDLERARQTVEKGLSRHKDYPSAHVVLGRILWDMGDVSAAEAEFRRVLELDPENRVALRGLGDLAREAGRPAEALERYRALLLLDPGDAEVQELARAAEEQMNAIGGAFELEQEAAMGSAMEPVMQPAFEPTAPAPEPTAWEVEPLVADDTAGFEAGPVEVGGLEGFEPTAVAGGDEGVAGLDVDPAAIGLEPIGTGAEAIDLDVDTQGIDLDVGGPGIDLDLGGAGIEGLELETAGMESGGSGPELDLSGLELEDAGFGGGEEVSLELDGGLVDLGGVELIADDSAADEGGADLEVVGPDLDAALLDLGPSSPDEVGEGDDVDLDRPVVTETMADLYARQGLHDRAAEVYRELLRGRPGDARLEAKLREVEGLAASRGQPVEDDGEVGGASLEGAWLTVEEPASGAGVEAEVSGAQPGLGHPGASAFGEGLPGFEAAAEPAAQAEAGVAEPAPVGGAVQDAAGAELQSAGVGIETQPAGAGLAQRTIGEYLHELLEFRSAGVLVLDESAVVEASAPHEPDEYDMLFDSPPNASASFEATASTAEAPPSATFEAPPSATFEVAPSASAGAQAEVGGTEPPSAAPGVTPPGDAPSSGSAGDAAASDDDEDLEMFRAWLQNLKR